jgi:pilus assembly protein Flp/PilA
VYTSRFWSAKKPELTVIQAILTFGSSIAFRRAHLLSSAKFKQEDKMNNLILKMYVKGQTLWSTLKDDEGQDLVEYALVVALIALAATVGMKAVATGINTAFTSISTKLGTYTS